MYAIIKTGGKQYSVKAGQILKVEKLEGKKGDNVSFKDVLAVSENAQNTIGAPLVDGAVRFSVSRSPAAPHHFALLLQVCVHRATWDSGALTSFGSNRGSYRYPF